MIYLDYSANTPADHAVLERFLQLESAFIGNPNSRHPAGQVAAEELEKITDSIAVMLGTDPAGIIYTSGASEANNLAIKGIARASRHVGRHILSTALEHPSVSAPLSVLQEQGYEIDLVDIGRDGKIDLEHFCQLIRKDTVLVAVSAVDSELGTVQPIHELCTILKDYPDCRLHVDATQAVGKTVLDLSGADSYALTAHKFYGLNGVGLLVKKPRTALEPLIHGGESTTIYRGGTPTLALCGSLETALRLALEKAEENINTVRRYNAALRTALAKYPKVIINSPRDAVPHILNLSVEGVKGTAFQRALGEEGVCVSVKSACSSDGLPSRAVFAVSRNRRNALSSWRISLSHLTTESEINEFLAVFDHCYTELTK